jgi:hypothetical protein
VVGCHHIVENRKTKAFLGLENLAQITPPIAHLPTIGTTGTERSD